MAGKQSQVNKNFWYAYALWGQKVAQALARRRAEALARKRAEAEARARQAQSSSQVNPVLALLSKLIPTAQKVVKLATIGVAVASLLVMAGSVVQDGAVSGVQLVNDVLNPPDNSQELEFCGPTAMFCPYGNGAGGGGGSIVLSDWFKKATEAVAPAIGAIINIIVRYIQQEIVEVVVDAFTPDADDVLTDADALTQTRTEEDESQYIILYHYTQENRVNSIIVEGLFPSIQPLVGGDDARYGDGQYFTDLTPEEASTVTRGQLAYALFEDFRRWGYRTPIAWMRFQFRIEDVRLVDELHGSRFPHRSIYLRDGTDTLSMSGILLDTGLVTFLIND